MYKKYVTSDLCKESKKFIGIDSLWGDIYKLQNLINFWTKVLSEQKHILSEQKHIKRTIDFCGIAVGYADGSKTEKELEALEEMFNVYKDETNSYDTNLSKEIITFGKELEDLVMILVKVDKARKEDPVV